MLTHSHLQILLHLAALSTLASSLSPQHLSSALLLLPQIAKCPINFGKDLTSANALTYSAQFFFYDGVRCSHPRSENGSAAFIIGNSQTMFDITPVVNNLGDVVVLNPKIFQTPTDRNLVQTRQNTVIPCGETAIREILFLASTKNATLQIRGRRVRILKDFLYAFVDQASTEHEQFRMGHHSRLCVFKGALTRDIIVNAETGIGKDRAGLIAAGVFGVAVLALILYGGVFLIYRKTVESELSDDSEVLSCAF